MEKKDGSEEHCIGDEAASDPESEEGGSDTEEEAENPDHAGSPRGDNRKKGSQKSSLSTDSK